MTQKEALDILKLGHNVYLTGSAGSGKTYLLNQYIDYLRKYDVPLAVTASTGIAATHLNGMTIHSWSGLGIKDSLSESDIDDIESKKYLYDRFQNTKVLIIDEVSMLHHFRLDLVERVVRTIKRNNLPFGGIQVILCGDFFQLPPISRSGEPESHFVYMSQAWQDMNLKICYLHEQHRQADNDHLLSVLDDIRTNNVTEKTLEHLRSRYSKSSLGGDSTKLYTHNADVDNINNRELAEIKEGERKFEMTTRGNPNIVITLKKSCLAPETLYLKKGSFVMFVKNNYESGYVNGTLGKVVDFEHAGPVVMTKNGKRIVASPDSWAIEEDGKVKAEISQVPLRLAWAITVHKSQGMSLDAVEVDLSKSFEPGMGYVALSRARTLKGLTLLGLNKTALQVHDKILLFDKELITQSEGLSKGLQNMDKGEIKELQEKYLESVAPKDGKKKKKEKVSTVDQTLVFAKEGLSLKEMADKRKMTIGTIISHLEQLVEAGKLDPAKELKHLRPDTMRMSKIEMAFKVIYDKTGSAALSPVKTKLGHGFSFEELRLARLFIKLK
ncbi:MAG: AAA family ATPase [bacterium]|nr:AAA family ATPase [bacterium]